MIEDDLGTGAGETAEESAERKYYLFYPVTRQRFVGAFSGIRLDSGTRVVANIPFGGMHEKDIVEVVGECECPKSCETVIEVFDIATEEMLKVAEENALKDDGFMDRAKTVIDNAGVKMNLVNAHLMPFSRMLVLFFSSPGRIDFRPALSPLSKEFKMSINLQQVSFKSEARKTDCYGICGRKLCCRNIPGVVDGVSVSHKKVKEQKESLNSSKMQGPCGKFFCCFSFEDEFYKSQRKSFPCKGDRIIVSDDEVFKVKDMNYVSETIKAENEEKGVRTFRKSEIRKTGNGEWHVLAGGAE